MTTFLQAAEAVATSEETRMGLWTLFTKGGWLMWPLLALGGVTIFIFVERFMAIRKASVLDMNFMNRIRDYISDGKISTAVNLSPTSKSRNSKTAFRSWPRSPAARR